MPALTALVVVAEFTAYCRNDHEITVVTDGRRVAAHAHDQAFTSGVTRDSSVFRITCDRLDRFEEPCGHEVEVDQSDHTTWRAATDMDVLLLDTNAQQVDE